MFGKKRLLIIFAAFLVLPVSASGQLKQEKSTNAFSKALLGAQNQQSLLGFIGFDPARFTMTQSYSLSYGSLGGQSVSQGVYLNRLSYQFTMPLHLSVEWGMAHNPLQNSQAAAITQSGLFLSNARLRYEPSENLRFGIEYSSYPTGTYPYGYQTRNVFRK